MLDARELANLVRRMRREQARYFDSRSPAILQSAKLLEKQVDAACDAVLAPSLFVGLATDDPE